MSSNASTIASGVAEIPSFRGGVVDHEWTHAPIDIERQILYERIGELERELENEHHRRQQIIDRYEYLLRQQRENDREQSLFEVLF